MMILKKYVLLMFIKVYLVTLSGLIGIYLIIDFFERVDEFMAKNAPLIELVSYYLYKIPFIIGYMAPQGVLLATVITLASLARQNEFTAMKACGISVTGITLPIIGASVFISILVLASSEYLAPVTNQKMNYIFEGEKKYNLRKAPQKDLWHRAKDHTIWNIKSFNQEKSALQGVIMVMPDEDNEIKQRIDAIAAVWSKDKWYFIDGYVRHFKKGRMVSTEYFETISFPTSESPQDFAQVSKRPEEMSLREMYSTIQVYAQDGKDTTQKQIDLQRNLSYPFISIVLALLAIPLSMRSSRHGGLLFCVGINLTMGFLFSFLYALSISLGRGGTFDPVLAAWGPNLLFTTIGFYLLLTMDSEKAFRI